MNRQDRTLADIATKNLGLVTLDDSRRAGLSRSQIKGRLGTGLLVPIHPGVYRLVGVPESWQQAALAACLAAPENAVASHLTAVALAGLGEAPPPIPHVTVAYGQSTRLRGVVVHRARRGAFDEVIYQSVPCTPVARALIDCASILGPRRLQKLVDQALHRRLTTPDQIAHLWDHARLRPGRHGEVRLREALEPWHGPIQPGSPAELRLRRQLVEWGYPEPELQVMIVDEQGAVIARVDLGWPNLRIGIEYDSPEFHGPSQWVHDEARHQAIQRLGWTLLHADKLDLRPGEGTLRQGLDRVWTNQPTKV